MHQPLHLNINFHCKSKDSPWPYGSLLFPARLVRPPVELWIVRQWIDTPAGFGSMLRLPGRGWHFSSIAFTLDRIRNKYTCITEVVNNPALRARRYQPPWAYLQLYPACLLHCV